VPQRPDSQTTFKVIALLSKAMSASANWPLMNNGPAGLLVPAFVRQRATISFALDMMFSSFFEGKCRSAEGLPIAGQDPTRSHVQFCDANRHAPQPTRRFSCLQTDDNT
jgi:hypothetical protein